jgi:glycosyltransferase involved in cell wall biosynthesis
MQKINWIILAGKDRGIDYGVGTFIKQLSQALKKLGNIHVFIVETGITRSKFFSVRVREEITILEIPVSEDKTGIDSRKNQEKLILYTGRFEMSKGLSYLFMAMEQLIKKIPNCRLVMAGNGNFESIINLTKYFSGNISFLGFIPFEDVVSLCHVAHIGVIPSLQEQCSYVALEMMHCGLPVVASDIGGLKEIFVHNENALLTSMISDTENGHGIVPDAEQLENNMFNLLTNDEMKTKFSQNAVKRANKMFTAGIMAENYLQAVKDLNQT